MLTIERFPVPVEQAPFDELVMFAIDGAAEVAKVTINTEDLLTNSFLGVSEGRTWVARRDGKLVGLICMIEFPYWYNHMEVYWNDLFIYIDPAEREDEVFGALARAVRQAAIGEKKHAWLRFIGDKRKRGQRLLQLC